MPTPASRGAVARASGAGDSSLERVQQRVVVGPQRIEIDRDRAVGRDDVAHAGDAPPPRSRRRSAIARALIAGSIRSSNSTISAESPAGTIRSRRVTPSACEQLLVDAAEAAVRHQRPRDRRRGARSTMVGDDVVDRRRPRARDRPRAVQVAHQLRHRQPLGLRQRRAEHRRDQHFVGAARTRARSRPETRAGTTTPSAARTPPRCARRDSTRAAPASVSATAVGWCAKSS